MECVYMWIQDHVWVYNSISRLQIHTSSSLLLSFPRLGALHTSLPHPRAVLHFPPRTGLLSSPSDLDVEVQPDRDCEMAPPPPSVPSLGVTWVVVLSLLCRLSHSESWPRPAAPAFSTRDSDQS